MKKIKYKQKNNCHYCKKPSYSEYHVPCMRIFTNLSVKDTRKSFKGIQRDLIKIVNRMHREAKIKTKEVYKPLMKMISQSKHVRIEGLEQIKTWIN